jgi:glycosyltransferase involved in cell wall biosynthesis
MVDNWGGKVRRVSLGENRGFSAACNRGAWHAKSDWLLFLNNDTEALPGWIEALTDAAVRHGSDTIFGAKLLYPDDRIQHTGVAFDGEGQPVHVGKGCSVSDPRWMDEQRYPAVTAAAMGVSRLTFLKLGGFDEQYMNGYEDVDFCLKASERDVTSLVVPGVQFYHYQGHTPGRYQHDARNEELFQHRWAATIQAHSEWQEQSSLADNAHQPEELPTVSVARRRFMVVMGEPPNYPSPTLRLISPLNALKEGGFLDYVIINATTNRANFRRRLESIGGVNAVILQRTLPHDWMMEDVLEYVDRTNTPLIVDTDDLMIGRHSKSIFRKHKHISIEKWFLNAVSRSSVVTVSTDVLKQELSKHNKSARIEVLPNLVDPGIWQTDRNVASDTDEKVRIGYFGSETHTLDLAMITPAIRHILNSYPGQVELCCWGCITEELKTLQGVRYMGPYDPDYNQYAARLPDMPVHFALVPLMSNRFNRAKSPIKYLELGISGIPGIYSDLEPYHRVVHHDDNGMVVSNNTWDWVKAISKLIEDSQHRTRIARNAQRDVIEHHMLPAHLDKWREVLNDF